LFIVAIEKRPEEINQKAFWRARHEAWRRSELNQREYCEAQGIPLKAFGNWRAKFKTEPQPLERKLLYRRGGLRHTLSHRLSHTLSHMTYGSTGAGAHERCSIYRYCCADKGLSVSCCQGAIPATAASA